jgi:uncharacterized hydrophobic protein (TIGR00341 family)
MALRLIEFVLKEEDGEPLKELIKDCKVVEHRQIHLQDGEILVRILLDAERNEAVLDLIEKKYLGLNGNRLVILPVEATLPREVLEEVVKADDLDPELKPLERIAREELYEDIKSAARCSRVYLMMALLSTVVAAVGLQQNSVVIIIGAMVMAPSIGPSMALSLAVTLGDLSLLRKAYLTGLAGIGIVIVLSVFLGTMMELDPTLFEVESRTRVGLGDVAVAIASGCAGALSFTTGVSAVLIGVMVAVALLPPLVNFGMLLGNGQITLAMGALSLFLMNIVCVNLSGVITFLVQGIQPTTWWEKARAKKAIHNAILLWIIFLFILVGTVWVLNKFNLPKPLPI